MNSIGLVTLPCDHRRHGGASMAFRIASTATWSNYLRFPAPWCASLTQTGSATRGSRTVAQAHAPAMSITPRKSGLALLPLEQLRPMIIRSRHRADGADLRP
jgi:hypothetical protein